MLIFIDLGYNIIEISMKNEEIRLMQAGSSTVADSMKRHLVTLEREERNLHQSMEFCNMLKSEEKILQDLPVESLLLEMEDMEKRGTSFSNKQEWDVKPYYYVMPTIIALGMTVLMGGLIWLLVDMFIDEPEEAPPLPVEVVMVLAMFLVIVGVLLAFVQRIKEIRKGEAEDAKKY